MTSWIVLGVIVLIALWAIAVYNGLVGGRNQSQTAIAHSAIRTMTPSSSAATTSFPTWCRS